MDKSIKRFSDLEASGVFSDRASKIEYLILLCIYDSGESIGHGKCGLFYMRRE